MTRRRRMGAVGVLLFACLIVVSVAAAQVGGVNRARSAAAGSSCLNGQIKHMVYLQFDNTHYRRDNQSVASYLDQMPHLLNFLKNNGTLFTNDHTILISHTAGGILSTQTGLYPDRHGVGVSNSYFYFPPSKIPAFSTAFKYWTDRVDDSTGINDPLPNMVTDGQKTTPAPRMLQPLICDLLVRLPPSLSPERPAVGYRLVNSRCRSGHATPLHRRSQPATGVARTL